MKQSEYTDANVEALRAKVAWAKREIHDFNLLIRGLEMAIDIVQYEATKEK